MTQKEAEPPITSHNRIKIKKSTRIENAPPDLFDPNKPRLGRRESEPHSAEINYIHDVLTANFPESRTIWDLHHYFEIRKGPLKGEEIDIQFDISFFKGFSIPHLLTSYDANDHEGRVPDMVVNVLSKSTWKTDLSENVDIAKNLEIPVFIVFSPYKMTSKIYHPPFVRAYILKENGSYRQEELHNITLKEGETINNHNIIDLSDILPFRLGLMQLNKFCLEDLPLYRLIFIDPSEPKIFPTKKEQMEREKEQVEREKEQVEREKEQVEREKEQVEREKEQVEKKLKKYRDQFGKLE